MSANKSVVSKEVKDAKGFFQCPNKIFNNKLTPIEKLVYQYLLSNTDSWTPGTRMIGEAVGCSHNAVGKAINTLVKAGMIEVKKAEKGHRDEYWISSINNWNDSVIEGTTSGHPDTTTGHPDYTSGHPVTTSKTNKTTSKTRLTRQERSVESSEDYKDLKEERSCVPEINSQQSPEDYMKDLWDDLTVDLDAL